MIADQAPVTIDAAVMVGDLSDLTTQQRADYYHQVCESRERLILGGTT
jgi:hypothetical protein